MTSARRAGLTGSAPSGPGRSGSAPLASEPRRTRWTPRHASADDFVETPLTIWLSRVYRLPTHRTTPEMLVGAAEEILDLEKQANLREVTRLRCAGVVDPKQV